MRKILSVLIALVILAGITTVVVWALFLRTGQAPASQLFINAKVLTMDANNTLAQAVAVEAGHIVAVGTTEEILAYKKPDSLVHDLHGKTLLPGFIDAHGHFPGWGGKGFVVDLNSPPLGEMTSIKDIQQRLSAALADKPAGEWLVGVGYDDSLLEEKRHPDRRDLDAVSTQHPVFIMHVSGHISVGNSRALALAGIDKSTVAPEGGVIQRDSDGKPNGVLEETARLGITGLALDFSVLQFIAMAKSAAADYARVGVTTAQSGLAAEKFIQGLSLVSKLGVVPQRLELWPDQETGLRWADGLFDPDSYNSEKVHIGAVKLVADGSIQGFTGYLSQPYYTPPPAHNGVKGDKHYRGYPAMEQSTLNTTVARLHKAGLQIAMHVNGDEAVSMMLDAVQVAQENYPREDVRHIAIHAQMAREDQLQRMLDLGVTPSFFSAHTYYWGDRHRDIFMGPQRAANMSPTQSALEIGLPFSVHLDSPVVPMDPLFLVWSTVNRLSSSGKPIGQEQRIDPMQALRAITIDAAWQIFQEKNRGSIEVGKFADLVLVDGNPLENVEQIRDLRVLETIVGGVSIYRRDKIK
jgi:hypothetical protein